MSDNFGEKVEPLIPKVKRDKAKAYQRRKGGGRKPMDSRKIFEAMVYVLRTGIQWKALPGEYGSSSSIHRCFQKWSAEEFFQKTWKKGLAQYDDLDGIAWKWKSIDVGMIKTPMVQKSAGANPAGRGKKWNKTSHSCRRMWSPVVNRRNRSKST